MNFPKDTQCGIEDFQRCGWKDIINDAKDHRHLTLWTMLSDAARKSMEDDKIVEGKVLWLLAEVCSMALKPASLNLPFEPSIALISGRSTALEDFAEEDIAFFSSIVEEIDDPWLQARVADVVWLLHRPRNPKHALMAIDAYRAIPLSFETFLSGSVTCWDRAVCLTKMLRAGAGDRLKEIADELCSLVKSAVIKEGVFCLKVLDVIERHHLGNDHKQEIAPKMETMAREADADKEHYLARQYFDAASRWFLSAKDKEKAAELVVCSAETFVQEAKARLSSGSSGSPSYMVAASFFEDAILKLRHVPRAQRQALQVDERIAKIHAEMTEIGEKAIEEMRLIATPPIDISDITSASMSAVRGKEVIEAFTTFVNFYPGIAKKKVQEAAEEMLKESIVQSLFAGTQMSRDGRVIGKTPASSGSTSGEALWAEMVRQHGRELRFLVHGCIWPALEILRLEHRVTEEAFVTLAANSPIVPPGRVDLFGKALFAGFNNDFVTALHVLVPQIENLVRWHLKSRGIKTTNLDTNGIENENGLSTLAELPEMEQVFGEDFTFEVRALFCDPFGPNLRNEVAHGLLTSDSSQSEYSIYAWWFALRIIFRSLLYAKRQIESSKASNLENQPTQESASEQDEE